MYQVVGMTGPRGERGATLIGLLFWAVLLVLVAVLTAKIFPVYYEYWSVITAVRSQAQSTDSVASDKDVRDSLLKRFEVADVDHVEPEDIQVERDSENNLVIRVSYGRKVKLFGNMSACFDFSTQASTRQVDGT